jgi:predicted membrane chloride channel (bestrophin family)
MSKEAPFGLAIMEKLIGLIMIAVGAIAFYVTYTNLSSAPAPAPFLLASMILAVVGVFLVLAKTGEQQKQSSA